ncbi:MAG: sulfotransferase family 2 domain-containing protein [Gammaproteobacteria bacterium]
MSVKGVISQDDIRNHRVDAALGRSLHDYVRDPAVGLSATTADLKKYSRHYKKIIIVRNPYSRVASFYCDKILKSRNRLPALNIRSKASYPEDLTFRELVELIASIRDQDIEQHLRGQLHSRETIHFDYVVKIEQFDAHMSRLSDDLNIPKLPFTLHRNKTRYAEQPGEFVYDRRPDEFDREHPPAYPQFFDAELKRRVGERYRRDIEAFGYSFSG